MARKRRSPAPFQEPPRVPRGYANDPTAAARPMARDAAETGTSDGLPADLPRQYAHVKKDLARIAILGAIMFGLIYVSTLFLL